MKNYFSFSRGEKIGVVSMSLLIITLTFVLNVNSSSYLSDPYDIDTSNIEYVSLINEIEEVKVDRFEENISYKDDYQLHKFDPNQIEAEEWMELGFSEKQALSIIKYRTNYGPFTTKEDLKKPFVIDEKKYLELEPFIEISNLLSKVPSLEININTASPEDLQRIKGIGEVYSERIIKYRNILGGFHSGYQLNEVYGLNDETLAVLCDNLVFDNSFLTLLAINTATKKELKDHPYINFEISAAILKERESKNIENLNFLIDQGIINIELKNKLEPYILF